MTLEVKYLGEVPCIYKADTYAVVIDEGSVEAGYSSNYCLAWWDGRAWIVSGYGVDLEKGLIEDFDRWTISPFVESASRFVQDWSNIKPILKKNLIKELL